MQKKYELERKNLKKERGELLMDVRAALQNMVAMLVCVKRGDRIAAKKPTEEEKQLDVPMMEKMEAEGSENDVIISSYRFTPVLPFP